MLKLNDSFSKKKLSYWGFKEHKGKLYKDIESAGWLWLEIDDTREVKITFEAGEDVKEGYTFTVEFDKTIFDLIKAGVFVWS